jgi:hypothetical protein
MIKKITRTAHNTFNFYITKYTTNGANIKGFFALKKIIDNLHGEPEKKILVHQHGVCGGENG